MVTSLAGSLLYILVLKEVSSSEVMPSSVVSSKGFSRADVLNMKRSTERPVYRQNPRSPSRPASLDSSNALKEGGESGKTEDSNKSLSIDQGNTIKYESDPPLVIQLVENQQSVKGDDTVGVDPHDRSDQSEGKSSSGKSEGSTPPPDPRRPKPKQPSNGGKANPPAGKKPGVKRNIFRPQPPPDDSSSSDDGNMASQGLDVSELFPSIVELDHKVNSGSGGKGFGPKLYSTGGGGLIVVNGRRIFVPRKPQTVISSSEDDAKETSPNELSSLTNSDNDDEHPEIVPIPPKPISLPNSDEDEDDSKNKQPMDPRSGQNTPQTSGSSEGPDKQPPTRPRPKPKPKQPANGKNIARTEVDELLDKLLSSVVATRPTIKESGEYDTNRHDYYSRGRSPPKTHPQLKQNTSIHSEDGDFGDDEGSFYDDEGQDTPPPVEVKRVATTTFDGVSSPSSLSSVAVPSSGDQAEVLYIGKISDPHRSAFTNMRK